jgi:REP element-mobilizing transposase RayT
MAHKYSEMHLHLRRLDRVWLDPAIFFVTACTRNRKAILASEQVAEILIEEWQNAQRHGWHVGRYVIMPDHVHLFCAPDPNAASLSDFVGAWKRWSSRRISKMLQARFGSGNFSIISCVPKKATTKNGTMFAIIQSGPTWRKTPPSGHLLEKLRHFVSNNLCNSANAVRESLALLD